MKAAILFVALAVLVFTEYAVASRMMGMTIPEFVTWGWRV